MKIKCELSCVIFNDMSETKRAASLRKVEDGYCAAVRTAERFADRLAKKYGREVAIAVLRKAATSRLASIVPYALSRRDPVRNAG